ncbi:MAG: AAA family ATPase [Prevotella sp.]|nr:AAA family ATPase [Prevotella sp.]
MFDDDFDYITPDIDNEYEKPDTWTIISALDRVLSVVLEERLSKKFWKKAKNPIDYLTKELDMTGIQVAILAILLENDEPMTWKGIAKCVRCSRLSIMKYSDEIEDLVLRRWLMHRNVREFSSCYQGFGVAPGVADALRENRPFVPEKIDGLELGSFVNKVVKYVKTNVKSMDTSLPDDEDWMLMMCEANSHLPLCREALKYQNNLHDLLFFMMTVCDYAEWGGTEDEGLNLVELDQVFPDNDFVDNMKYTLCQGTHRLLKDGLIEHACVDGMAFTERFVLTRECKEELLEGFVPQGKRDLNLSQRARGVISHTSIKEKAMFYNPAEQQQIERLTNLLSQENLPAVQQRLADQGMRKGFACLFYGAPGTGKTETVLQMARRTGRDILQVDIAGMRDKFVGETEKNIKAVFDSYRRICKCSEVTPILFFNEADAIFNKRTENVEKSVDKMDNAMQNIILQELEDLEGILIATTNLTSNLDNAFERRFLFKVEFHMPEVSVKQLLWSSMLQGITDEEARLLAVNYNFSGGQIENIARQRAIDYILSGKQVSMEDIEGYCKAEMIRRSNNTRSVVGFR